MIDRPPSPHAIFHVGSGFMAAQQLFAAAELGVFAALMGGACTLDELAARLGLPARTLQIVADAMVVLGFLVRDGERIANAPIAAAYLAGGPGDDLRPFLRHWQRVGYAAWAGLAAAVRDPGPGVGERAADGWLAAARAITPEVAMPLAGAPELAACARILVPLDATGGITGALLERHARLQATIVETEAAVEQLRGDPRLAGRAALVAGDPFAGPFPGGHDGAVLVHAVHYLSPERNVRLLQALAEALTPGAPLLIVDYWVDDTRSEPAFALITAGEFLLTTGEGRVYARSEAQAWLAAGGFDDVEHRRLVGPASVIVARRAGAI